MSLKGRDKEFRLPKVTYIDYKHIDMDRVLTMLFPRLKYDGYGSRRPLRANELSVELFAKEFCEHDEWFLGFSDHPDIVRKWIETDLMDVVNRGKPNQAVATPRPLHGNTYKFRNTRHTRDYGAAEQIYWMLFYSRLGQSARDALKRFFFPGIDLLTDKYDPKISVDVETQALLRLDQQVTSDMRDSREPERYPPLCAGQANLLADDVLRLLAYEDHMPRSVLVEYLKVVLSFHLALYHLRLLKLLPTLVHRRGDAPTCASGDCSISSRELLPSGGCPYPIGLVVDMGDDGRSHMARLARRSADTHYRRIPQYIHAQFIVKKLDEMADYLGTLNKVAVPAAGHFSVRDLTGFLESSYDEEREPYFKSRLAGLIEEMSSNGADGVDPEIRQVVGMGLGDFDTYIEILVALRGRYHRQYITECLDSLLLKNRDSGLLRQSRAKGSHRRFALGSRLLEALLQIAVLETQGSSFVTREVRVQELILFLRERYGIYIDCLPPDDGFGDPSIVDQQAMRENVEMFKTRLREIGFYRDLSDAYITQTVTPRYRITAEHTPSANTLGGKA